MENFSLPSFSLGLDADFADLSTEGEEEEEEAEDEAGRPLHQPSPDPQRDEECALRASPIQESEEIGVQENLEEDPPPRVLKRLRRGPPSSSLVVSGSSCRDFDGGDLRIESCDDIEDFSSPEKVVKHSADDHPSSHITCSNSKFSLLRRGFLRGDNSVPKQTTSKPTSVSGGISTLTGLDTSNKFKDIFPRLTISPIRKINLIDSDSDDSSGSKAKCRKEETIVSLRKKKYSHEKCASWDAKRDLATRCQKESFWKDFDPMRSSKVETPALDEFCNEYFRSVKDQSVNQDKGEIKSSGFGSFRGLDADDLVEKDEVLNSSNDIGGREDINWDFSSPRPPSYQYFCHDDSRIRTLVCQRLPHFTPLGVKNDTEDQQFGDKNIDYMGQFIVAEKVCRSSSSKKQNKESKCNVTEASNVSGSWVNPRNKAAAAPKDAGRRRVSADVHQAGHWFTDQDGRKVYVGKDGEKSTGRTAYRKYRKETGGFRKAKRKAAAKKNQKSRS